MSIADSNTPTETTTGASAKIVQLKEALQEKTGAVTGWASGRADAMRGVAAQRPLATAGISAGAAFLGGIAVGLLLSGQLASMKGAQRSLSGRAGEIASRAKSLLKM